MYCIECTYVLYICIIHSLYTYVCIILGLDASGIELLENYVNKVCDMYYILYMYVNKYNMCIYIYNYM